MVTYLGRNVTIVCGASYHLLGSQISQDSKIQFRLQVESYISDWRFSESQHLASYVSRLNAMAYDMHTWLFVFYDLHNKALSPPTCLPKGLIHRNIYTT
jgi:hypothetical protein